MKALIGRLLDTWLEPLRGLDSVGDPLPELQSYIRRKLEIGLDRVLVEEGAPPLQVANDGG